MNAINYDAVRVRDIGGNGFAPSEQPHADVLGLGFLYVGRPREYWLVTKVMVRKIAVSEED